MKHQCFDCDRKATFQLITQFAGTHLYCETHAKTNSEFADMVAFPGRRPKPPPPPPPTHLRQALDNLKQDALQGTESLATRLGFEPELTHEELLQEVWYLRRRVKELERQNLNYSWQLNPEAMGR